MNIPDWIIEAVRKDSEELRPGEPMFSVHADCTFPDVGVQKGDVVVYTRRTPAAGQVEAYALADGKIAFRSDISPGPATRGAILVVIREI